MYRLRFQYEQFGKTMRQILDSFDELGMPVRRTASTLDGEHASYQAATVIGKGKLKKKIVNTVFFDNWRRQMLARVKFERNHPSIFIWETDNEFVFINLRNFGNLEVGEPEIHKGGQMVMELDPTRDWRRSGWAGCIFSGLRLSL